MQCEKERRGQKGPCWPGTDPGGSEMKGKGATQDVSPAETAAPREGTREK